MVSHVNALFSCFFFFSAAESHSDGSLISGTLKTYSSGIKICMNHFCIRQKEKRGIRVLHMDRPVTPGFNFPDCDQEDDGQVGDGVRGPPFSFSPET